MEEESGLGKLADCTPLTNFRYRHVQCCALMSVRELSEESILYIS
jgi:hypothetical protein